MNRRRKIITRVIVFLLLGAIVNVAVAWACVAWAWKPGRMDRLIDASASVAPNHMLMVHREDSVACTFVSISRFGGTSLAAQANTFDDDDPFALAPHWIDVSVPSAAFATALQNFTEQEMMEGQMLQASGWPWRSLWSQLNHVVVQGTSVLLNEEVYAGIPIAPPMTKERLYKVLPYIPIWPGFAINTIFYAAIVWLLFFAPGSVRRTFRRRRGLCPACAYPVGSSPVCTECGKAVANPLKGSAHV